MKKFEVLLFDLGGVLVEFSDISKMLEWTNLSLDNLWQRWIKSPAVRNFESGKISIHGFSGDIVNEFNLPISPSEFGDAFLAWPKGLNEGIDKLLLYLSKDYRLACFSNTNENHWPMVRDEFGIGELLDECFISYQMGLLKPDQEAFNYVINSLGCLPEKIAFFDDNEINTQGAMHAGIKAFKVDGVTGLKEKLLEIGVL